ncbi:zinc finger protein 106 isoform X2 [Mastacembelus armatus]|uniref:zinc finger protein 106 isoform X2 n=1 Tax=Mastacembelus armatus TaxID=205130 RepID=UPI000E464854|nr:zinc finger protein 106-like isoform X2 [Mastacembelus armatus]
MAKYRSPKGKVGKAPVKSHHHHHHHQQPQSSQQAKKIYCILCRLWYLKHAAQEHVHSMLHHRELENLLGAGSYHECQACKMFIMGLNAYADHISTSQHKAKLTSLISKNVKPHPLIKTLSAGAIERILERNKTLKKEEKKAYRKIKKKQKQVAGKERAQMLQEGTTNNTVASKVLNVGTDKQVIARTHKEMLEYYQKGGNNAVVQNKENKGSGWQGQLHPRGLSVQDQSGGPAGLVGQSAGRTQHQPNDWDNYSTHHSFSVNSQHFNFSFHKDRFVNGPQIPQENATVTSKQSTGPATSPGDYYNRQYSSATEKDFTSDQLPEFGAIIFDHCQNVRTGQERSQQEHSHCSTCPASANGSISTAPTPQQQAADIGVMLRQIRRALGVREPCRADREARRQSSKAGVQVAEVEKQQSRSGICSSSATLAKPKQATFKMTEERPKSRLSWREMYQEMKRKKNNHLTEQESTTQPQDQDLSLSEGFHWESFPESPSAPNLNVPPPPQHTADFDTCTEREPDYRMQEPLEQPGTAHQSGSSHSVKAACVKVESNLEGVKGGLRDSSSVNKRNHNTVTDDRNEPAGKKKKTKTNKDQGQMDQLLAVSLREDELSRSLQDLDQSLVQARNALQAAYTEVQRLLLLRQQFTAEVNSLRAKRIEILQGMQGYSGASCAAEKATTSSAGVASVQPRRSPLPSSTALTTCASQHPPPSSVSHPHPTHLALSAMSVKQEIHHAPAAGQPSHFANTVSSNTDAPQLPLNQPVPLFSSNLLLQPSQLTAPTIAAASTSVNAPTSSQTSARQQEVDTNDRLEDCAKTVRVSKGEARPTENDSMGQTGGNLGKEQVKRKKSAAEKSVPARAKNQSSAAQSDGNESDDSVKMMPSNLMVINIDESDNEGSHETITNIPVHADPHPKPESVELSSASTQTCQQSSDERKVEPSPIAVTDASLTPESVEVGEPSLGVFVKHMGPVHGLQVHDGMLYTCSGDNTARAYCLVSRECRAVFEGHTNKVNCLLVSSPPNMLPRLYTGSSDQTIRCYSIKSKKCVEQISLPDRVLCLHIAWNTLYAGLADGSVASYDLSTMKQLNVFECHGPRGVSCLGTAQEGARRVLLVGSYDSTISVRDAKSGLLLRSLEGHTKTVLCMKVVNDLVFSGSSDTSVHAHNIHTGELVRIYKGHGHAVTSIVILGKVMVTACLDKLIRVYELQSHDRLQVYGGHSDMVMCMAVHKSVIYTGCYDGSVQSVKLNLMKNYRCWWQSCSLIFGIAEHLVQHLLRDHSSPNMQFVKCRWRSCDTFFTPQHSVKQELPEHMQSHVEKDSKVEP